MTTRLRNACDTCHKLKRRCTGTMPCENCASLGTSCFYSVAGRLGRPRGSKSRRNTESMKSSSSQPQKPVSGPIQNNDSVSTAFSDMLELDFDGFDHSSSYKLSINPNPISEAAMNLFSTSETDALQNMEHFSSLDSSSMSRPTTGNNNTPSISPMQLDFEQQQRQQQSQREPPIGQQAEPQLQSLLHQQQQNMQWHPQQSSPNRSNPPSCQCIPGLSALLHALKRAGDDKIPPTGLDDVLFSVSDALAQWSAFAACPRCQDHNREDDDGETLLLATLSIRRVVAQLNAIPRGPGLKGLDETDDEELGPQLRVGAFQVTGSDRAILLGVLRTITARKLNAAITTMQSILRTKRARRAKSDAAMLHHIESMLEDLSSTVKLQ